MGYYINTLSSGLDLPVKGKAKMLIWDGAKIVKPEFQPNLVCVVENPMFDAAGYCYDQDEFNAFNDPRDYRRKTWLVHPKAAELSGFNER